jgi:hypothetical protein
MGHIEPPSSWGHRIILAATDYFSKWVEAVPLHEGDNFINFLERHIVYRFGIPHRVTSDNRKTFKSGKLYRFVDKYKIKWSNSAGYYPQADVTIEAFNKTLGKILKKTVTRHRRNWHDRLRESLSAYRVTVCTPRCKQHLIPLCLGVRRSCPWRSSYPLYRWLSTKRLHKMSKYSCDTRSLTPSRRSTSMRCRTWSSITKTWCEPMTSSSGGACSEKAS